jgi:hypothetical protein
MQIPSKMKVRGLSYPKGVRLSQGCHPCILSCFKAEKKKGCRAIERLLPVLC